MADVDERMIRDCLAAVRVRVGHAETQVARAVRQVGVAEDAVGAAEAAMVAAADDWHRQMQEGFDPTLGALLARSVLACSDTARIADDRRLATDEAYATSLSHWRVEDARRRALEETASAAHRRQCHRREERNLAVLADRETLKWMNA